ncbi:MAG: hypothetical protein HRU08_12955 [Oleispira sp.]|nr:hypothetical protein [Oleispira sp.]
MIHKTLLHIMTILFALLLPSTGIAKIAGYNVIFIHGFIPYDPIIGDREEHVLKRRILDFAAPFWVENHTEGFLNWSAADRIEDGIAKLVVKQAKQYSANGLCHDGCVLVTHSTGDLVARYFLANQKEWLEKDGYEPLKIIATIDFGGAGGGTDIADKLVNVVDSDYFPLPLKLALGAILGLDRDIFDYQDLGALLDLQKSKARSIANWPNDIPRLRFSGSGKVLGGRLIKMLIPGADDGVVPAHSSCGAASADPIDSCSNYIGYDGKQGKVKGPSKLLYNHFPVLMSDNYGHLQMTGYKNRGQATAVLNDFYAGLKVDFETHTKNKTRGWFRWRKKDTYQFVKGSN